MPVPAGWVAQFRAFNDRWRAAKEPSETEAYIGDRPFDAFVLTERAASWDDFENWVRELRGQWCYRGQGDASWNLDTLLDRSVKVQFSHSHGSGYYHLDRPSEQAELLSSFQKQAHEDLTDLPPLNDVASWLALMQHHGAPTRLLDWTASPHISLYFAVASRHGCDAAVWALDLDWLESRGREIIEAGDPPFSPADCATAGDRMNRLLLGPERSVVVQIAPSMVSERMAAQQGLLLCKLRHEATFSQILMRMMIYPSTVDRPVLRRIVVPEHLQVECLDRLAAMHIERASLLPGADRVGKSLKVALDLRVRDEGAKNSA